MRITQTLVSTSLSESLPDVEERTSFDFGILLQQGWNIRRFWKIKPKKSHYTEIDWRHRQAVQQVNMHSIPGYSKQLTAWHLSSWYFSFKIVSARSCSVVCQTTSECKCLTKTSNTEKKVENDSFLNQEACEEVDFWCQLWTLDVQCVQCPP